MFRVIAIRDLSNFAELSLRITLAKPVNYILYMVNYRIFRELIRRKKCRAGAIARFSTNCKLCVENKVLKIKKNRQVGLIIFDIHYANVRFS